jgi:putative intracellular protease/amidase
LQSGAWFSEDGSDARRLRFGGFRRGSRGKDVIQDNMNTPAPPLRIGAVIFPNFELLDIYGPLELLGLLGERISITMLAEEAGEVKSNQGPMGIADASVHEDTSYYVLVIPGGQGTRALVQNDRFLDALRKHASRAQVVASICTGSALLARAGLLDGKRATSNKIAFNWVMSQGPNVTWIRQARWVEDGPFFTASGVSAGMDMTLGLIQHLFGKDTSNEVARRAEYVWNDDKTVDPFFTPEEPISKDPFPSRPSEP